MKQARILALTGAVCSALALGMVTNASAASLMSLAPAVVITDSTAISTSHPNVIRIQKTGDTSYRKRRRQQQYQQYNNTSRKRRHKKTYRKQRYYNPGVWVGGNTYYDPYYDDPYYDPYYDTPTYYEAPSYGRYSCGEIIGMLRQKGYRRIEARDCTGKVYTFFAYAGHKRYKLRIRSKNGSFKTRKRI